MPRILREIKTFVNIFSRSSITSIDKFLSLNPVLAYYGKIGITLSILSSEENSSFGVDIEDPGEDWYSYLLNRMMEGLNKPDDYKNFAKNKVAFITFNYDRSLEYILCDSFYHSFHQNRIEIERNIEKLIPFPIIHVYGVVTKFKTSDWPEHDYKNHYYENYLLIEELSKGIRCIGEERTGDSVKDQIKKLLPDYKRIFFLGFGYAQENFDAMGLLNNIDLTWKIYGTAKGMTDKEIKDVRNRLPVSKGAVRSVGQIHHRDPDKRIDAIIEDENCFDFLREYL